MHLIFMYTTEDYTYTMAPTVTWSYIEIGGGVVSACMPVSKPAFLWMTTKIGLTGERGLLSRPISFTAWTRCWKGFTSRSAGDTEPRVEGHVFAYAAAGGEHVFPAETPSPRPGERGRVVLSLKKYLRPGDSELFQSAAGQSKSTATRSSG